MYHVRRRVGPTRRESQADYRCWLARFVGSFGAVFSSLISPTAKNVSVIYHRSTGCFDCQFEVDESAQLNPGSSERSFTILVSSPVYGARSSLSVDVQVAFTLLYLSHHPSLPVCLSNIVALTLSL